MAYFVYAVHVSAASINPKQFSCAQGAHLSINLGDICPPVTFATLLRWEVKWP